MRRKENKMSIERARAYLKQFGVDRRIKELDESSATVQLAAAALGVEEQRIAKTLSFSIGERVILIVVAGDARVDNKKYKAEFSSKAKMLKWEEAEEKTGHAPGGVCPFGVKEGVEVYLDTSLKRFETVFPACGSSASAIELTIDELERFSGYLKWVDVCKAAE